MPSNENNSIAFSSSSVHEKYQKRALAAISKDFEEDPGGRFLLVIPTGGGKTITAIRSINAMYSQGILDDSTDHVLWVTHRNFLTDQAKESLSKFEEGWPEEKSYRHCVRPMMQAAALRHIETETPALIVIDECHHVTEDNSWSPFFDLSSGILGLTATPSRHDAKPLPFDRESFSIGFPELIADRVILSPEVRRKKTQMEFGFSNMDEDGLSELNNPQRNKKIIEAIIEAKDDYKKIIVFVGTIAHVKDLCQQMKQSKLADHYDKIGYVIGNENSECISRKDFLKMYADQKRSIVVNAGVLTEGFDDPTVNTIVMAHPTNSKLVYMQSMGRGVRRDEADINKKAFLLEVVDHLPNIRYRIDNRWLFSDISDALEPAVEDRTYSTLEKLKNNLTKIYDDYSVPDNFREYPEELDPTNRLSMLLFKCYVDAETYKHLPVLMGSKTNRKMVTDFYNYMSLNVPKYARESYNHEHIFGRMIDTDGIKILDQPLHSRLIYDAFINAARILPTREHMSDTTQKNFLVKLNKWPEYSDDRFDRHMEHYGWGPKYGNRKPWVTFVSLRYQEAEISEELQDFIDSLVNKESIKRSIQEITYQEGDYLVRFPLPLENYVGEIMDGERHARFAGIIEELRGLRALHREESGQREIVDKYLGGLKLPFRYGLTPSLSTIVREGIDYAIKL